MLSTLQSKWAWIAEDGKTSSVAAGKCFGLRLLEKLKVSIKIAPGLRNRKYTSSFHMLRLCFKKTIITFIKVTSFLQVLLVNNLQKTYQTQHSISRMIKNFAIHVPKDNQRKMLINKEWQELVSCFKTIYMVCIILQITKFCFTILF